MKNNVPSLPRSYEKVNYLLRPRKQIERKILIDIFKRVRDIHTYHYIGLGSIFYYDFILFHKYLNIKKMTSLDDKETVKRFNFNKPYDFIAFVSKKTTEFLEENEFRPKVIIWFDYDSMLYDYKNEEKNESILKDIEIITYRAVPLTFFLLTVDIRCPRERKPQDRFRHQFESYLPSEYKDDIYIIDNEKFFSDYKYMIQSIILNSIEEQQKFQEIKFHKLFSFFYRDTAPMYTLGGVYETVDGFKSLMNQFSNNEFINSEKNYITDIDVPILTYKEKIYLDSIIKRLQLAARNEADLERIIGNLHFEIGTPEMLEKYIKYYRYYPQYYEGII